uniref:Uncharacterized protein n=1 Tax=Panagrolaimus davidi TaxID=227884 RepID=A0A914PUV4_9BILA
MKSFVLLLAVLFGIFYGTNAHPGFGRPATFEYCAQYPEIECKFWSPIDSTCRWCDNMNRCAPYCLQTLPQTPGGTNSSVPAASQVLQPPQSNLPPPLQQPQQPNYLLPQPQQLQQPPNLLLPQQPPTNLFQMPAPFNNLFAQNNLLGGVPQQPQQQIFSPPPVPQQPRWIL